MIVFNVSICRLGITLASLGCFWGAEVEADAVAQRVATDAAEPILNINVGTYRSGHSATLFTDKSWSFEAALPSAAENCSYHLIMTDALGNSVAIWSYFDTASNRNVLDGAQLPFGGGWTAATTISSASEDVAVFDENPTDAAFKLAVDETGMATVIWNAYIDGILVVRSSMLSRGSWSFPVTINHFGELQNSIGDQICASSAEFEFVAKRPVKAGYVDLQKTGPTPKSSPDYSDFRLTRKLGLVDTRVEH